MLLESGEPQRDDPRDEGDGHHGKQKNHRSSGNVGLLDAEVDGVAVHEVDNRAEGEENIKNHLYEQRV